jgi:dephospho-CoA kinase
MLKIGLTGGIASGKSTVAALLEAAGAALVDTDLIAREMVEPGHPGLSAIRDVFGPEVLTGDGSLDRRKLRAAVFADDAKRRRLEAILHPLIRTRVLERINALRDAPYVVIAVPLLVETNFAELVDRVLVVDVPVEVQLARLVARDGISRGEAEAMIAAQADRETRLAHAHDVIDNSGDPATTRAEVEALHRRYLELATVCRDGAGRAE